MSFNFSFGNLQNTAPALDRAVKRDLGITAAEPVTVHELVTAYGGTEENRAIGVARLQEVAKTIVKEDEALASRQAALSSAGDTIKPSLVRAGLTAVTTYTSEKLFASSSALAISIANPAVGYAVDYVTTSTSWYEATDWSIVITPQIDRAVLTGLLGIPIMLKLAPTRNPLYSFLEWAGSDYSSRLVQPTLEKNFYPPKTEAQLQTERVDAIGLSKLSPAERAEHEAGHPNPTTRYDTTEPKALTVVRTFWRTVTGGVIPGL
jgi:hypothetical protein